MKIIPIILFCCLFSFALVNCTAQAFVFGGEKKVDYDTKKGLTESAQGVFNIKQEISEKTPAVIIGTLLEYLLTLLGLVFLIVVIIGGFIWMTAGGDSAKTDRALKMIINGVIGLIIAVAAYAIVNFVMNTVIDTVSPTPLPEDIQP